MLRRSSRRFAYSLIALNAPLATALAFSSAAGTVLGAQQARAQSVAATAVQTAVILDFDVAPGLDPAYGRKAADAVAVELKSSGDFDVVARQRVEEIVATVPGLHAPYTPATARRLGETAGANIVITGRIVAANVTQSVQGARTARVQMEMRQQDARTGDFVNGAQPSEITVDTLQDLDDDVLMDQSLDKAAYGGVRQMRLYVPAEVTITSNIGNDVQFNRGGRDGVRRGQRYSVLRDHFNPARRIVERIKIAEVSITSVETFQSSAVIVDGGAVGIHTGDKARRIYASGIAFTEPTINLTDTKKRTRKRR